MTIRELIQGLLAGLETETYHLDMQVALYSVSDDDDVTMDRVTKIAPKHREHYILLSSDGGLVGTTHKRFM